MFQDNSQEKLNQPGQLNQDKSCTDWGTPVLVLVGMIISGVIVFLSYRFIVIRNQHLISQQYFLGDQVVWQWNKNFKQMDKTCPQDYQVAFQYAFKGGFNGCNCRFDNLSLVLQGFCSQQLANNGCKDIADQDSFKVSHWNSSTKIHCIKRNSVNFLNQSLIKKPKQCGRTQSSVLVPQNQQCPIVNITQIPPLLQQNYKITADTQQLILTLNATSPFSGDSFPINLFKVSQNKFCKFFDDLSITNNRLDYSLARVPRTNCTQAPQYQYTVLKTQQQQTFFSANSQLMTLGNKQGYYQPGNYTYKLAFKNVPSWLAHCRYSLYPIKQASDYYLLKADRLSTISNYASIGILSCIFLLSFLIIINLVSKQKNYSTQCIMVLGMPFWVIAAGMTGYVAIQTHFLVSWGQGAISNNCTSQYFSTQILLPKVTLYSQLRFYGFLMFGLTLVALLFYTSYIFILIRLNKISFVNIVSAQQPVSDQKEIKQNYLEDQQWKRRTMQIPDNEKIEYLKEGIDDSMAELREQRATPQIPQMPVKQIKIKKKKGTSKIRNLIKQLNK